MFDREKMIQDTESLLKNVPTEALLKIMEEVKKIKEAEAVSSSHSNSEN